MFFCEKNLPKHCFLLKFFWKNGFQSGYSELKDLIPQTTTSLGCKTTNAAILFRACDFMNQLKQDISESEKELNQLNAQAAALEMIASEYEQMASSVPATGQSTIQVKMVGWKRKIWISQKGKLGIARKLTKKLSKTKKTNFFSKNVSKQVLAPKFLFLKSFQWSVIATS